MSCENFRFEVNYFDENGNIRPDLFSDYAKKVVECFISKNGKRKERRGRNFYEKDEKITQNQIRKFYEEILNLKDQYDLANDFKKILPYFKMLKAKAHLAYERDNINTNFKTFIEKNVDYVGNDEEKFKIFCTFFEAIVAYSKGIIKDQNRG